MEHMKNAYDTICTRTTQCRVDKDNASFGIAALFHRLVMEKARQFQSLYCLCLPKVVLVLSVLQTQQQTITKMKYARRRSVHIALVTSMQCVAKCCHFFKIPRSLNVFKDSEINIKYVNYFVLTSFCVKNNSFSPYFVYIGRQLNCLCFLVSLRNMLFSNALTISYKVKSQKCIE